MTHEFPTPKQERHIAIFTGLYLGLPALPEEYIVQKGSILKANEMVARDPIFGGSEILILGYNSDMIFGTSLVHGHAAYMFNGTWGFDQLKDEIQGGVWNTDAKLEGTIRDYYFKLNEPQ